MVLQKKKLKKQIIQKMSRDEKFEEWYDEYFCDTQGEDSPYSYMDVKIAFYSGWKAYKRKISESK